MAVDRRDFLCYDITTGENMDLGERVRVDGRLLSVSCREAGLLDGRVLFTYRLAGEGYSCVAPYENEEMTGQSLLSTFSAFCMNDRFDYLSPCTILDNFSESQ